MILMVIFASFLFIIIVFHHIFTFKTHGNSMEDFNIWLNDHNRDFTALKKLIYSMNLIPSQSKHTWDSLTQKILQQLEKGVDFEKLESIIEFELGAKYGLYIDEFNSEEIATDIMDWWNSSS